MSEDFTVRVTTHAIEEFRKHARVKGDTKHIIEEIKKLYAKPKILKLQQREVITFFVLSNVIPRFPVLVIERLGSKKCVVVTCLSRKEFSAKRRRRMGLKPGEGINFKFVQPSGR